MFNSLDHNLSFEDISRAYLNMVRYRLHIMSMCRIAFDNYLEVIYGIWKDKYPIRAMERNGKPIILRSFAETSIHLFLAVHREFAYNIEKDEMAITSNKFIPDKEITTKLHGSISNGDVISVFLHEEYAMLPVKGKTVVDIGANIADSSIYFALRGATRVISLEPFPDIFELAKENVYKNNLSDKISLILAGFSGTTGSIRIRQGNHEKWILRESREGFRVPLMTLRSIIENHKVLPGSILKVDCEGCEYDAILSCEEKDLLPFAYLQIEYHYGFKNLKNKLEDNNFDVRVTAPTKRRKMYTGMIYARREYPT
jgi:FkbM family methyltransferase